MDLFKTCCAMFVITGILLVGMYWHSIYQATTQVYACSEVTEKDPIDVQRLCKQANKRR
jgi:hypothetical protein